MQIVLVRHGATDWNLQGRCQGATDRELSSVGIQQAQNLAAALESETICAVYSSNLKRARQTAALVSNPHKVPVLIEESVRELHHGALEGLTFSEIKENYPDFLQRWRVEPAELQIPGGERLVDVAQRAWDGLNKIAQKHESKDSVVVVSHNFPILGILCRVTGTPLNDFRSFHLDPCGVTRLNRDLDEAWQVTHINNQTYPLNG